MYELLEMDDQCYWICMSPDYLGFRDDLIFSMFTTCQQTSHAVTCRRTWACMQSIYVLFM
jgi:hypothetical protein